MLSIALIPKTWEPFSMADTKSGSVLLVEDNKDIAEMVYAYLERRGYELDYAADGVTGLHLAVTNTYDVVVLDLMLPGMDGIDLCRKLRDEARRDTPILMLTARDTLGDKVAGLDAGADDYPVPGYGNVDGDPCWSDPQSDADMPEDTDRSHAGVASGREPARHRARGLG
jgi:CheY-like chemotaxis protein